MENITLNKIYSELLYLRKKVEHIEQVLIPEVEATAKDKEELGEAIKDYKEGKTVSFRAIKRD